MNILIPQAVAACLAAAALASALAGCTATVQAAPERTCDATPVVADTTPTVAILGQVGGALDGYDQDVDLVVQGAVATEAHLILSGVGEAGAPSLVVDTLMTGEGVNAMVRDLDLACKRELVATGVGELSAASAASVDVFRSIMTLDGNLTERTGAPIDVVLLTSLASDAEPVDLTDPQVLEDPVAALNTLAAEGLIPDCTGWRFHGVSTGGEDDPALREFWRQYALRCGGAVVAWTTHLTVFPGDAGPIAAADTEQIEVKEDDFTVTADLEGDVLFGPGSFALRSEAGDALNQLLALTRSAHGDILIVGHTDVGGVSEDDNEILSENRGNAVADWLIGHRVDPSRITVEGHGSRDAIYPNPQTEAQHQANRRVVVTIEKG
ncbi:MAG TPA: OmpA family protein [Pseudolysinimonas sp.]|nr:OmpA family protein [Pseudolysinimonas sp.]